MPQVGECRVIFAAPRGVPILQISPLEKMFLCVA
jgi:hypothetical protein